MELPKPFRKRTADIYNETVANTSDSAATTIYDQLIETGSSSIIRFSLGETPAGFEPETYESAVRERVYKALKGRVPIAGILELEDGRPPQKTSGPPYLSHPKPQGSDIVFIPLQ